MKIFVSYCSRQGPWVWSRLVPVLKAALGPDEVLVDRERFKAGRAVYTQMDEAQDQAERHILCLSADYHASAPCRHEMARALAQDPAFATGRILPLRLDDSPLPDGIALPDPIWIDMRTDTRPEPWRLLLDGCGGSLGMAAPKWLEARDEVARELNRGRSVNLVQLRDEVAWRGLVHDLEQERVTGLAYVDLHRGATETREGLLQLMLESLGLVVGKLRRHPNDLADFEAKLAALQRTALVALAHADIVTARKAYDVNLFASLRWLVMDERRLVLLVHSRMPFAQLLPQGHKMSEIDMTTVELR